MVGTGSDVGVTAPGCLDGGKKVTGNDGKENVGLRPVAKCAALIKFLPR